MVALMGDEDLRLVHQPAEGDGVDDAVAVALERRSGRALGFRVEPAAGLFGPCGEGRQPRRKGEPRPGDPTPTVARAVAVPEQRPLYAHDFAPTCRPGETSCVRPAGDNYFRRRPRG